MQQTHRKQARPRPAHHEVDALLAENQALLNNAFVGIIFVKDRHIIRTNRHAETLFGYAPGELIGRSTECIYPDHAAFLALGNRTYPVLERGETFTDEVELVRKDGSRFWCLMRAAALALGQPQAGIIWMTEDVTGRKQAQAALQASLSFQKELLEAIPTPVFYKDTQGRYQNVNGAFIELFGGTAPDLMDKTVYDSWPLAAAEIFFARDQDLFAHPGVQVYEARITNQRGEWRDLVFHKATLHYPDGRLRGLIGSILDITERKAAEAALRVSLAKLERHDARMIALNWMNDLLLSCETLAEAYTVIARGAARLFAGLRGALAVVGENPAADLRVVATWGEPGALPATFPLNQCWALRRGAIHEVRDPTRGALCRHFTDPRPPPPPVRALDGTG